ncbi:hypothetical protein LRH25_11350 [Ideonella azotifigens]|nr:hypothetical protein [Ideonella azotifigens]MCD2340937.1 hypothetical protein [Ideonella azotifigens]
MSTNDPNACTASLCGRLESAERARGSKSEHQATLLRDDAGDLHPLRRAGGSPFTDPALQALEGQRVNLHGQPRDGYFLIIRIEVLPG